MSNTTCHCFLQIWTKRQLKRHISGCLQLFKFKHCFSLEKFGVWNRWDLGICKLLVLQTCWSTPYIRQDTCLRVGPPLTIETRIMWSFMQNKLLARTKGQRTQKQTANFCPTDRRWTIHLQYTQTKEESWISALQIRCFTNARLLITVLHTRLHSFFAYQFNRVQPVIIYSPHRYSATPFKNALAHVESQLQRCIKDQTCVDNQCDDWHRQNASRKLFSICTCPTFPLFVSAGTGQSKQRQLKRSILCEVKKRQFLDTHLIANTRNTFSTC